MQQTSIMSSYLFIIAVSAAIFAIAIPYVARIRHPQQKPLAAYFIFMSVFAVSTAALFNLLTWLAIKFGLGDTLSNPGPALLLIILALLPAIGLATWLARKPPWRQGPTD